MTETRRATPGHSTGVVSGTWDAAAQQGKLPSPMPVGTAAKMYAWIDPEAIDAGEITKSGCKLPHHQVDANGRPGAAVVGALAGAVAALNGGRGGVDLPDSERQAVYNHLAKHYRDADLEPPELKARPAPVHRARYERRRVRLDPAEFRAVKTTADGLPTSFTAVVVKYGVIDDYLTRFRRGVFDKSMEARMPRICWAHDWTNPIGRWTDVVSNDDEGLELAGEFDDFGDVPSARRAAAQLKSGTMDQFSVGFYRLEDEEADGKKMPGVYDITRADLVEASPVIEGSVPGTALTGMRSRASGLVVPLEEVERIVVRFAAGAVDVVDALNETRELAEPADAADADSEPESDPQPDVEGDEPDPGVETVPVEPEDPETADPPPAEEASDDPDDDEDDADDEDEPDDEAEAILAELDAALEAVAV